MQTIKIKFELTLSSNDEWSNADHRTAVQELMRRIPEPLGGDPQMRCLSIEVNGQRLGD